MKILILEDNPLRIEWFANYFKGEILFVTDDPQLAIKYLDENQFDKIFLDHDLLPEHYDKDIDCNKTTGLCVAEYLGSDKSINKDATIVIHSRNWNGAERMLNAMNYRPASLIPFDQLSGLYI
jgi:CheY-like chemotaxis protein